jgi:hypothetical protein
MILFHCKCGEELEAAEDEAGQVLMCPICKAKLLVPSGNENILAGNPVTVPSSPVVQSAEQHPLMILFRCQCGELEAAEDEAGQLLMCPICKARVRVPRRLETIKEGEPKTIPSISMSHTLEEKAGIVSGAGSGTQVTAEFSGKAAVSLVLGLLMFIPVPILILCCIPAIIMGVWGLVEIRRNNGRLRGSGLAIAGIVIGVLTPLIIIFVLTSAVRTVREAADNAVSQNNLKQIVLALNGYHDAYKAFPQQAIYSADGRPLLSWRVAILGFIEQENLRRLFKLDEPWDSPHNLALLHEYQMPSVYEMPGLRSDRERSFTTHYQGLVGKNAFFRASHREKITLRDITDGLSSTLMVVEAAIPVPWTKPEDLHYDANGPLPRFYNHPSGGFNAALVNGSVIRIDPRTVSERTLRNAITINDGQPLGDDWPLGGP